MSQSEQETEVSMFEGMRRLVSGVCIVTARDARGERYAMTATSVTSVSGEPPSLLVCVNEKARIHQAISETDYFCISVLAPKHKQISVNCATPESAASRFEHGHWAKHEVSGVYYLSDAQAVFFCRKAQAIGYGTHSIFIGNVEATHVAEGESTVLAYMNGGYITLP
ncbi:flavin reductase (NADH) [Alteromonadaceae bacterium 2753L.S.0a.02]|nr:flavin reductase (NADH) [Alteromonadaceae bacterium 2753L.S.0a.02]